MRSFSQRLALVPLFVLLFGATVFANNVVISNVSLVSATQLQFEISWENSWRVTTPPANYDGVWLFVKRRDCATNRFYHVALSTTSGNHSAAAPLTVTAVTDGIGVFVHRSAVGSGNIASTQVTLQMTGLPAGEYDFQVYGIEMVNVPSGAFQVGDGGGSANRFQAYTTANPFTFTGNGAFVTGNGNVAYLYSVTGYGIDAAADTWNANFPEGFNTFWCMKYEVSQGQYVDFLNSLANDQATARNPAGAGNRYTIAGAWPNFVATAPNRGCNFLSWDDLQGYLDWAGLSPMTETEFEKCARGPIAPIADEYAWGTNGIVDANTVTNDGTATEGASDAIPGGSGIANYNGNVVLGPIRVGFAATALTNRMTAGSGYYGIMDLSGNLGERCIMINEGTQAMNFTGANGDGELTNSPGAGFANAPNWPTVATSIITRGGSWAEAPIRLQISDRGGVYNNNGRLSYIGGRGVRR